MTDQSKVIRNMLLSDEEDGDDPILDDMVCESEEFGMDNSGNPPSTVKHKII